MNNRNVKRQVLVDLIKNRICDLNELLRVTITSNERKSIKARLAQNLEWLVDLGEEIDMSVNIKEA